MEPVDARLKALLQMKPEQLDLTIDLAWYEQDFSRQHLARIILSAGWSSQ
jgi:hypothetical protein